MSDPRSHQDSARPRRGSARVVCDVHLVARAVEINEAIAAEFGAPSNDPRKNPAITRLEDLGFETESMIHEVASRAKQIFFHMRHGREPRGGQELDDEIHKLTEDEHAELVAVSVAWWDGVLTGLRARKLLRDADPPNPS